MPADPATDVWEIQPRFFANLQAGDVPRLTAALRDVAGVESATVMIQHGPLAYSVVPSVVLRAPSPPAAVDRAIATARSAAAAIDIELGALCEVLARPAALDPRTT